MLREVELFLPVKGHVVPLTEVEDYLFNKKIMGEGVAINPDDNNIYSPADGEIEVVYETKRAILIRTKEDLKILIHLGLNTDRLEGKSIATFIKTGDKVKKGDKLLSFNKEYLNNETPLTTPIVIVNTEIIKVLQINYEAVGNEEILMKVVVY